MKLLVIFMLFACSLAGHVSLQNSQQCVMDRDVHELLVKMKCELEKSKERLRAFEGEEDYSKAFPYGDGRFKHFNTMII